MSRNTISGVFCTGEGAGANLESSLQSVVRTNNHHSLVPARTRGGLSYCYFFTGHFLLVLAGKNYFHGGGGRAREPGAPPTSLLTV